MAVSCGPNEWEDATGFKWCSNFGTDDIIEGCKRAGVSLGDVMKFKNMNFGSFTDLIYYGIRRMAKVEGVTFDQFKNERLSPKVLMAAMNATSIAFMTALGVPLDDEEEADPTAAAPAALGEKATSSNSPDAPA